jgi:hypothetical protein
MTSKKPANPDPGAALAREPSAPALPASEQPAPRLMSRRALVRAGWTVPVVLALNTLPVKAFASPGCIVQHTDNLQVGPLHVDTTACIG